MAIPFLKGKPKAPPIDRVKDLSSKGFSEIEIIDVLRKEGYSPQEIDLALSQVLKESIEKTTKKEVSTQEQQQTDVTKRLEELAQSTQTQSQIQSYPSYTQNQISWEDYFSYVDYIIQSRVNEIVNEVKLMEGKYQELQKRIEDLASEVKSQRGKELELKSEISQNFYNLEKSIKDLSVKIEGMEEILKEILPTLIDSVRTLNSLLNTLTRKN